MAKRQTRHPAARSRRLTLPYLSRQIEELMATMQDVQDKIAALDAQIKALPKPVAPLATQDQIDAAAAAVDQASADLDASQAPA